MIVHDIEINGKIAGRVFIETEENGTHTAIEVWLPDGLLKCAINSCCDNINIGGK